MKEGFPNQLCNSKLSHYSGKLEEINFSCPERERIKYPTVCGHGGLNSKSGEPFGWASSVIHSSAAVAALTTEAPFLLR